MCLRMFRRGWGWWMRAGRAMRHRSITTRMAGRVLCAFDAGHDGQGERGWEEVCGKSRCLSEDIVGCDGDSDFDYDNDGHQDVFITDMHSDMSQAVGPNREKQKSEMLREEKMLRSDEHFGNTFFRTG